MVAAPGEGDVASIVREQAALAKADGGELLVYVGASWCEPCQRFHEAAAKGELDADFPKLTLIEFDADRDGDRLRAAGYKSRLIPLFCAPNGDGTASPRHIEGSIKGPGAVGEITPRLQEILGGGL
jgi:hypothetical protein